MNERVGDTNFNPPSYKKHVDVPPTKYTECFALLGGMNIYKILPSMVLVGLGLLSAWIGWSASAGCPGVHYYCGVLAVGYLILGIVIVPWKKEA